MRYSRQQYPFHDSFGQAIRESNLRALEIRQRIRAQRPKSRPPMTIGQVLNQVIPPVAIAALLSGAAVLLAVPFQ